MTSDCQKGRDISLLPTKKIVGKQNGMVVYWWLGRLNSKWPFEWIPIAVQYGWGMSRISSIFQLEDAEIDRGVFIISSFIWAFNLLRVPKFDDRCCNSFWQTFWLRSASTTPKHIYILIRTMMLCVNWGLVPTLKHSQHWFMLVHRSPVWAWYLLCSLSGGFFYP